MLSVFYQKSLQKVLDCIQPLYRDQINKKQMPFTWSKKSLPVQQKSTLNRFSVVQCRVFDSFTHSLSFALFTLLHTVTLSLLIGYCPCQYVAELLLCQRLGRVMASKFLSKCMINTNFNSNVTKDIFSSPHPTSNMNRYVSKKAAEKFSYKLPVRKNLSKAMCSAEKLFLLDCLL